MSEIVQPKFLKLHVFIFQITKCYSSRVTLCTEQCDNFGFLFNKRCDEDEIFYGVKILMAKTWTVQRFYF